MEDYGKLRHLPSTIYAALVYNVFNYHRCEDEQICNTYVKAMLEVNLAKC